MEITKAEKAAALLEEIKELSKYKGLLEHKDHGRVAHFEICQHYGDHANKIVLDHKYTPRFVQVVEQIIKELTDKIEAL